jgi:hypothetical protein
VSGSHEISLDAMNCPRVYDSLDPMNFSGFNEFSQKNLFLAISFLGIQ